MIYMFLSNNPSSGDINSSNLSCLVQNFFLCDTKWISYSFFLPSLFILINSFLVSHNFRCLLITFANSLDPDQDRHSVGPDLEPNYLTL